MIIFCQSKEAAVKVYRFLSGSAYRKESVSMFHASLTQNTKQERFQSSTCTFRCLVATVAFGMVCIFISSHWFLLSLLQHVPACLSQGMDIVDIELVVVYSTPDTPSQWRSSAPPVIVAACPCMFVTGHGHCWYWISSRIRHSRHSIAILPARYMYSSQ